MHFFRRTRVTPRVMHLVVAACLLLGCGKSQPPSANPEPFKAAIAQYLEQNNMAMALKEIKEGPIVEGKTARLKASLTHAILSRPGGQLGDFLHPKCRRHVEGRGPQIGRAFLQGPAD